MQNYLYKNVAGLFFAQRFTGRLRHNCYGLPFSQNKKLSHSLCYSVRHTFTERLPLHVVCPHTYVVLNYVVMNIFCKYLPV